ncbi:JmjC domain,JmjN domain [Cinara cedri]|uniref:JmjC domain,JmjN domain n=1 Tax=Cinara cedri TaxID=506608 RepID=A0A5E4MZ55_9HEMI|nr:JmjC domain,JmjN domain [Cinara cedri]
MRSNVSTPKISNIMVFKPTWDEFKDFNKYIQFMESKRAHHAGIAKIIPPIEWKPRKQSYDILDIQIPQPIIQKIIGKGGSFNLNPSKTDAMSLTDFKRLSETDKYKTPDHFDYNDLERIFWKTFIYNPPIFGTDVSRSLFDDDCEIWNMNKLGSILDYLVDDSGVKIDGVNTPYLYAGMWKSVYAWSTEDMDLYSINYIHHGSPRQWYAIPPKYGGQFERLMETMFSENYRLCSAFIRHKMCIVTPNTLNNSSIPWNKIVQEPGEIIITFPYGYHCGFNHGFNLTESTNFATTRWVEYGKRTKQCKCRSDMVNFSMETFVRKFQPEKYEQWIQGKDFGYHPEESKFAKPPRPVGPSKLLQINRFF